MMVATAVLTPVCWVAERRLQFQLRAEYHRLESSTDIICCVMMDPYDGKPTPLIDPATGMPTTPARRAWHKVLGEKYEKAARSPWLSVAPDPPRPE
jgi:hypothetical protein